MRRLLLIKLGGGVITDKNKRYGLRRSVLARLVNEIAEGLNGVKDTQAIIGNGAGSFAHFSAHKYRTAEGFVGDESRVGLGWVRYDAVKLNQIVFEHLLLAGLPVFSYSPSSFMGVKEGVLTSFFVSSLRDGLSQGMIPLVYGDAMIDASAGSTIFSTERVFDELIKEVRSDYKTRVIHINNEEGVMVEGNVFSKINEENFNEVKEHLGASGGVDVTGGMLHKVQSCLDLAKQGVVSMIVSGLIPGRVRDAILGKKVVGTTIC